MPTLKDIRKRIGSVKSTQQITRAMKMVASAKLRRAQEAILSARPYSYRVYLILLSLIREEDEVVHPLLTERPEKSIHVVVLAGDRGSCGPFNTNVIRKAEALIKSKESEGIRVLVECIGKKANDYFKKRREVWAYHEGLLASGSFSRVARIAEGILRAYLEEKLDAVYLVYNEFKSAVQQKVVIERLIPVSSEIPGGVAGIVRQGELGVAKHYLFEPSKKEILDEIIPRHFKVQLFRSVLESVASEHGARMTAMDNASKNALEMIDRLTLQYNKARQASITKELMEIVGGVEAMK